MTLTLLAGFRLPQHHVFGGREAYQCSVCQGISYPPDPEKGCPYCNEEKAERRGVA